MCTYCSIIVPLRRLLGHSSGECNRQACVARRQRIEQEARQAAFNATHASGVPGWKPKHPQPEVRAGYTSGKLEDAIEGWSSYKIHRDVTPRPGSTSDFFKYSLSTSIAMPKDYVTQHFNAYCAEAGIECTVTMDPNDFRQLFHFKNMGDRLVKIEHSGDKRFLEPGEQVTLAVPSSTYNLDVQAALPKITALNGGLG